MAKSDIAVVSPEKIYITMNIVFLSSRGSAYSFSHWPSWIPVHCGTKYMMTAPPPNTIIPKTKAGQLQRLHSGSYSSYSRVRPSPKQIKWAWRSHSGLMTHAHTQIATPATAKIMLPPTNSLKNLAKVASLTDNLCPSSASEAPSTMSMVTPQMKASATITKKQTS